MRVSQTTAQKSVGNITFNPVGFRGDIYKVTSIKELLEKIKERILSRTSKEIHRPSPLPAMSPFAIDYPITKQDLGAIAPEVDVEDEKMNEIRKAGF